MGHSPRNAVLVRMFMFGAGALIAATLAHRSAAAADQEQVLYSFCAQSGCTDGAEPQASLLMDVGNLYGTTPVGGAHGYGTAFELIPNAAKTAWTHKVLHRFCAPGSAKGCTDGATPSWRRS